MRKVSVIMAVYNGEKTLKKSIDSILEQTYKNIEIIICNDASTDSTRDILADYYIKNPNKFVIIENTSNMKLPYSLNRCIDASSGDYIARMDADDTCSPDRFELQVNILNSNIDISVVGTNIITTDEYGEMKELKSVEYPEADILRTRVPFYHATIMMRRFIYLQLNGYTVSKRTERGQDVDLWFRFFDKGFKGINIPIPLYFVTQSYDDVKRRKFKYSFYVFLTLIKGYKLLKYPMWSYIFTLKPIMVGLLPKKVVHFYHRRVRR